MLSYQFGLAVLLSQNHKVRGSEMQAKNAWLYLKIVETIDLYRCIFIEMKCTVLSFYYNV